MFCNDNNHKKQGGSLLGFPKTDSQKRAFCVLWAMAVSGISVLQAGEYWEGIAFCCVYGVGACVRSWEEALE